jgi:putative nucleotidyltransferase with HDIG domain
MSDAPQRPLPGPLWLLIASTCVAAAALAGFMFSAAGPVPPLDGRTLATFAIWLALVVAIDASPMLLPRGGATASVSSVLDLAAILAFGPAAALAIGVLAVLLSTGIVQRRPLYKVAFNGAQIALAIGLAGGAYAALGGGSGERLTAAGAILPLAMAAVLYFAVNTILVSIAAGLYERLAWRRVWQANFEWETIHLLVFPPLALLVALVLLKIGLWGVILIFIQMLVVRYTFKLSMDLREANRGIISVLATAIDANDPFTRGHSYRVSQYAVRVARAMNLPERSVELVQQSALLHDVGKICVGQEILEKPASLSVIERERVRLHPKLGGEMIRRVRFLRDVERIVATHHERPDGLGYPEGLRAEEVPIGARIVGVLDAYDAMTSDRPYRKALEPDVAIRELLRGAGKQFDERVVITVKRLFDAGELALDDSERTAPDAYYGMR